MSKGKEQINMISKILHTTNIAWTIRTPLKIG